MINMAITNNKSSCLQEPQNHIITDNIIFNNINQVNLSALTVSCNVIKYGRISCTECHLRETQTVNSQNSIAA